jgi:hypothetical protein
MATGLERAQKVMSDRRLQDLIRFYSILNELEKTIGGKERRRGKNISNASTRRIALSGPARSNGQSWKKPITIWSSALFF